METFATNECKNALNELLTNFILRRKFLQTSESFLIEKERIQHSTQLTRDIGSPDGWKNPFLLIERNNEYV